MITHPSPGGLGKTQIALRFIRDHSETYESGIMFINAESEVSILADFAKIHRWLNLEDSPDKVIAVNQWLSQEQNASWCMVFDNADNLATLRLTRYFPQSRRGHILVLSRDQGAIGGVTESGLTLEPLTPTDATNLLLQTANIHEHSSTNISIAHGIANALGHLPLAIEHAGAFIRLSQNGLRRYQDLFARAQHDLLGFHSRLSSSDHTVLSAWEVNFNQLERESPEAAQLLFLFSHLDANSIDESLLQRAGSAQPRWDASGEIVEVDPQAEGLDPKLIALLANEIAFDIAISKLRSFSFINSVSDQSAWRTFSLHPLVKYCVIQRLSPSLLAYWTTQATLVVCHAFPRSRHLDPM